MAKAAFSKKAVSQGVEYTYVCGGCYTHTIKRIFFALYVVEYCSVCKQNTEHA